MTQTKVMEWLKQMNLNYRVINEHHIVLLYDLESLRFAVNVNTIGNWIQITASMLNHKDISTDVNEELFRALLQQNYVLNDVTYSVDTNGSVFSENDIPTKSNFENFNSEFNAVVYGVKHFFEKIGPKFGFTKPSGDFWIGGKTY